MHVCVCAHAVLYCVQHLSIMQQRSKGGKVIYLLEQISAVDTQHSGHRLSLRDGIKERQVLPDWLVMYYFSSKCRREEMLVCDPYWPIYNVLNSPVLI